MNRLNAREENILDFIIRDYVQSAVPVSSGRVCTAGNFRLSPATLRNAMLELDEEGYLEQPHTSSGRIPTDKAYRYFVDNLMSYKAPAKKEKLHGLVFEDFARAISDELGLFSGFASFGGKHTLETFGLERLFSEPEFSDRNLTMEFSRLVDNLEKVAEEFLEDAFEDRPAIFIGEENPLEGAGDFSSVVMKFSNNEYGKCVIFSLGPKRMNYERASSIINFVVKDITE